MGLALYSFKMFGGIATTVLVAEMKDHGWIDRLARGRSYAGRSGQGTSVLANR